jgi:predicted nucleic acid-binding protein
VKEYVLDANAILRYLQTGSASGGDKVRRLFEEAEAGQARLLMSVVNLGDVLYVLMRFVGEEGAIKNIRTLQHAISTVNADAEQAVQAAILTHHYKLGYANSYAAALALERKATLVSADAAFQKLGRRIRWMKLPPFQTG